MGDSEIAATNPASKINGTLYVSRACYDFVPVALEDLHDAAKKRNAACGVTGILVYLGGRFFQYLEGSPESVAGLIEVIRDDPRHNLIHQVASWSLEERQFPDWSMNCLAQQDAISAGMRSIMFSPSLQIGTRATSSVDFAILSHWEHSARVAVQQYARLQQASLRTGE